MRFELHQSEAGMRHDKASLNLIDSRIRLAIKGRGPDRSSDSLNEYYYRRSRYVASNAFFVATRRGEHENIRTQSPKQTQLLCGP